MKRNPLMIIIFLIYSIYVYFLGWYIFYPNNPQIYTKSNEYSEVVVPKFNEVLEGLMSSIVLLLFVALLFIHFRFSQKKLSIFSSFLAASVLFIDPRSSLIAFALVVFGLANAFFELRKP